MAKKNLFFFTATFPYGYRESFIETEIKYLSIFFENITIIPLAGSGTATRKVPENCKVLSPIIRDRRRQYMFGLFNLRTLKLFLIDFFSKKVFLDKRKLKAFLIAYIHSNIITQSKNVKKILNGVNEDDVMYFYWGKGSCYLLPFFSKIKAKKIVRFHGPWDLWEESSGNYAPLRDRIVDSMNLAIFISKKGEEYFTNKYPNISHRTAVSYLGTYDKGIAPKSSDGVFRLLSCSNVIPIKRVHLIFESLQLIGDSQVEWTHIGDGIDFDSLKQLVKKSKSNVKVKLIGRVSNQEVITFYRSNMIDAFINVSTTEGVPVALMEAISFNVPVIGTNVGATSEIVNSQTGILLSANPQSQEIVNALQKIKKMNIEPKAFWTKSFNADINYPEFSKKIISV